MGGLFFILCGLFALYSMWNGAKIVLASYGFANAQPQWRPFRQRLFFALAILACVIGCILVVL